MGLPGYKSRKPEVDQRLLTLRARTRLTQTDLAGLMGVNRRSIQKWIKDAGREAREGQP